MSVNRPPFYLAVTGAAAAGPCTATGVLVGDIVTAVTQSTGAIPAADTFERIVSVAGQIQQTSSSNLSGNTYNFLVFPQGWKSIQ